jgi:mRNA interferase RelE/StbE
LAWTLEYAPAAQKTLKKLNPRDAERITSALAEIRQLEDPTVRGHVLVGKLKGLWRYRIEDWRIIVRFEKNKLVILVIEIGHRREIYR